MAVNIDNFYRQVEAASRLPSTYQNVGNLRAQSGSPFWEGFADARNAVTDIGRQIENARERKAYEEMRRQAESGLGGQTKGQIPDSPYDPTQMHGLQDNSWGQAIGNVLYQGRPEQTPPVEQTQTPSGINIQGSQNPFNWGQVLGGRNGNFQSPSSDIPQVQAEGGVKQSPNVLNQPNTIREYLGQRGVGTESPEFGADYGLQQWLKDDRENGVTNPLISLMRYQAFIEPMKSQMREDNLRSAFATLRNQDATDADKLNAYALMEYELKRPGLKETMDQAQERHQMAMEQARLGLDNTRSIINHRNFQDLGDYAGVNLEGKSWVRNNDGVDLSNAQPHTIAGLNHISDIFQQMTGKQLIVTSGNDGNIHAGGQFSHGKGWKVDVSGNGLEDPNIRHKFIQQCENLGIKVLDEYENPSPDSTGGHLDLQFSGYRGNVTGRRGNGSRYTNSRNSVNTNDRNTDMTDKEYSGITSAIDALNSEGTPENGGKLANALLNEYSRTLNSSGSIEVAADSLYKILLDGNKYGKLNLPKEQVAAIVADAVSTKHRNKGMAMQIKNMLLGKGGSSQTPATQQPANQNGDKTLDTINGYGTNVDDVKGGKYSFGNITIDERTKNALDKAGNAYKDKVNSLRPGDEIDRWGNVITKEQKQAEAASRLKDVLDGLFYSSDEDEEEQQGLD